jgi:hypothetical protein
MTGSATRQSTRHHSGMVRERQTSDVQLNLAIPGVDAFASPRND